MAGNYKRKNTNGKLPACGRRVSASGFEPQCELRPSSPQPAKSCWQQAGSFPCVVNLISDPFTARFEGYITLIFGATVCQISLQRKRTCGNRARQQSAIARRSPHCVQL